MQQTSQRVLEPNERFPSVAVVCGFHLLCFLLFWVLCPVCYEIGLCWPSSRLEQTFNPLILRTSELLAFWGTAWLLCEDIKWPLVSTVYDCIRNVKFPPEYRKSSVFQLRWTEVVSKTVL